jgi:hypothetical protein
MNAQPARLAAWLTILSLVGCRDGSDPSRIVRPSFDAGGVGRPAVLVNPHANSNGTAKTIQEGIGMVAAGGSVMVLPGTYVEQIVIDKGLTLEAMGGESGSVIVAPSGSVDAAIQIATPDPVTIRGLTIQYTGVRGIFGNGVVDVTIERAAIVAVNPPLGASALVSIPNDAPTTGRSSVVVRESFLDGGVPAANSPTPPFPQTFGITLAGDVDAQLVGNVIRHAGGACIFLRTRNDLAGAMNVDITNNDLDECYPLGRVAAILVGPAAGNNPTPDRPLTATGVVNIVGNTIRNSAHACVTSSAIAYEVYTGRIEHNRILNAVPACATPTVRNFPSAISVGRRLQPLFPPVTPTVRFNDIAGNAQAGLGIAANQTLAIDASCNWWGSADGPSGAGSGNGDAIVIEAGGATPTFSPFATAPIAESGATGC